MALWPGCHVDRASGDALGEAVVVAELEGVLVGATSLGPVVQAVRAATARATAHHRGGNALT